MILTIKDLTFELAEFPLEIDTVFTGKATGITGPSGSGKTTLLEVIAGLRSPKSGRIALGETVLTDVEAGIQIPPERRRIGYVPQDLALFPHLNVRHNLFFGQKARLAPTSSLLADRVIDLLEIRPLLDRRIHAISGGERQRVAIGRALLAGPQLLLLDEPLSNLDARLKDRIIPYLQAVRHEFEIPLVYVSHFPEELSALCEDVRYMEQGRMI